MGKKKEVFNVNVGRDMSPNKKTWRNFNNGNVDEQNSEKSVSECNKLRSLIKNMVERNITILSKQ